MGAIRAIETRQMSGVAMMSEFLLLDAKLCEKAKQLELFEENFFRHWAKWQGQEFTGQIKYPMAFHIRDKNLDMDLLQKAAVIQRDSATASADVKALLDQKVKELLAKDEDEFNEMMANKPAEMTHPPIQNVDQMIAHLRDMISQGYTDEQIKQLHPELGNGEVSRQDDQTQ